ncbi:hypothetical protein FD754_005953 [Muntiacus muntjak]|uniref:Uncharacterized protein n=1 Tax=Muntiacus muntjak TaxID=9888 RepID=A0A5N3WLH7_MUNMU|nr:hypothetical protein FD754_005953 [Muntiacus muntjak]
MSRLLPLLRSRTARSLRPGPAAVAAAPRPPSWCCCGRGLLALAAPGGPRALGTHPKKEPMEALNTAQGARDFIYSLHSSERSCLLKELHRFESIAIAQDLPCSPPPTPHPGPPYCGRNATFSSEDNALKFNMNTHSHSCWLEVSVPCHMGVSIVLSFLGNIFFLMNIGRTQLGDLSLSCSICGGHVVNSWQMITITDNCSLFLFLSTCKN